MKIIVEFGQTGQSQLTSFLSRVAEGNSDADEVLPSYELRLSFLAVFEEWGLNVVAGPSIAEITDFTVEWVD